MIFERRSIRARQAGPPTLRLYFSFYFLALSNSTVSSLITMKEKNISVVLSKLLATTVTHHSKGGIVRRA